MDLEKKRPARNGSEGVRKDPLPSTQDLFTVDLLYRYATCDDLITLKTKYPQYCFKESHAWGLKQMGTLFCIEKIEQLAPAKMLEVGVHLSQGYAQGKGMAHGAACGKSPRHFCQSSMDLPYDAYSRKY